jgi:hypothetical protein
MQILNSLSRNVWNNTGEYIAEGWDALPVDARISLIATTVLCGFGIYIAYRNAQVFERAPEKEAIQVQGIPVDPDLDPELKVAEAERIDPTQEVGPGQEVPLETLPLSIHMQILGAEERRILAPIYASEQFIAAAMNGELDTVRNLINDKNLTPNARIETGLMLLGDHNFRPSEMVQLILGGTLRSKAMNALVSSDLPQENLENYIVNLLSLGGLYPEERIADHLLALRKNKPRIAELILPLELRDEEMQNAARDGAIDSIIELRKLDVSEKARNEALKIASQLGFQPIVDQLLPIVTSRVVRGEAAVNAALGSHWDIVLKILGKGKSFRNLLSTTKMWPISDEQRTTIVEILDANTKVDENRKREIRKAFGK